MRSEAIFVIVGFLTLVATPNPAERASSPPPQTNADCAVTIANGIVAGEHHSDPGSYGNAQVSVGLWRDGIVVFEPGGAGFITRDGSLGMKFGWRRGISGQLKVEGHRVDAVAPPLRSEVPSGYGDRGFQATYVIFPTPGCWEVAGGVDDATVTFITRVAQIGDGPAWRRDVP